MYKTCLFTIEFSVLIVLMWSAIHNKKNGHLAHLSMTCSTWAIVSTKCLTSGVWFSIICFQ